MKIVELCGLPGSGKTTLFKPLRQALSKHHKVFNKRDVLHKFIVSHSSCTFLEKTEEHIRYWFNKPSNHRTIINLYNHVIGQHNELFNFVSRQINRCFTNITWREYVYIWFYKEHLMFEYVNSNKDEKALFLMDEGFVHRSITFFGLQNEHITEDLAHYIRIAPQPDMLVHLSAEKNDIQNRLNQRQDLSAFFDIEDHAKQKEIIKNFVFIFDTLMNENFLNMPIVKHATHDTIDDLVKEIRKCVE